MSYRAELSYFFSNAPWPVIGQIFRLAAGLLLTIAFAQLSTPEIYGQYNYVLSLLALFSVFSLNGLNLSVMKAVIAGAENALRRGVRISFISSLAAVPVLLAIAGWKYWHGQATTGLAIGIGALLFPFLYSTNTWTSFLEAKRAFRAVAWRASVLQLALSFSVILTVWLSRSLPLIIAVSLVSQSLLHGFFYFRTTRLITRANADLDVRHGLKISLQKFAQTITASLPSLVIAHLFGYQLLAVYSIFFSLIALVSSVNLTVLSIYLPQLLDPQISINWLRWLGLSLVLGILITLAFFVGSYLAFLPLYGAAYADSYRLLILVLPLAIFFPAFLITGHYLTLNDWNWSLIFGNLLVNAISLVVLVLIYRQFSFIASAAIYYSTLTFTHFLYNFCLFWLARSLHSRPTVN